MSEAHLPEYFFRHEYGRLVAVLTGRVGVAHLELVEDAVQSSLLTALESWRLNPIPNNPSAWLYTVAYNHLISEIRQNSRRLRILERFAGTEFSQVSPGPELPSESEIKDDLLGLLFFCSDPALPTETQLVLSLKTLCGFDVREIALRLFMTEENVYKRVARGRSVLRRKKGDVGGQAHLVDSSRLAAVHHVLYSMFSEGYLSSKLDQAIREDLCAEAIRLTLMLAQSSVGSTPETAALLALMYLHGARNASRTDGSGGLVLLEEQDRSLWNRDLIQKGLGWLELSARGETYSRYHSEAAIAAEHCLATSFASTNWRSIVRHYDLLLQVEPSALHQLNRSIAIAEAKGPIEALASLKNLLPPTWLAVSYQWSAVLADLHYRTGDPRTGSHYFKLCFEAAPTDAIKTLLLRRFASYPVDTLG